VLNFYRALLRIRKHSPALRQGKWRPLIDYPHEQFAYLREADDETILVVINYVEARQLKTDKPILPECWEVLLSNRFDPGKVMNLPRKLEPFEVSILKACP
jgi:alpha-glucosidase